MPNDTILPKEAVAKIVENAKQHFAQPGLDFVFDVIDEIAVPLARHFAAQTKTPFDDMAVQLVTTQAVPQLKSEITKAAKEAGLLS